MLRTLRTRLLASYMAILVFMLGFIGLALIVFLRSRPLPTDDIVNDLTATLLDLRVVEPLAQSRTDIVGNLTATLLDVRISEIAQLEVGPSVPGGMDVEAQVFSFLSTESAAREIRVLLFTEQGQVIFDSAYTFDSGTDVRQIERNPLVLMPSGQMGQVFSGRFLNPDGSEWVYVSQPLRPRIGVQGSDNRTYLVIARPAPSPDAVEESVYDFLTEQAAEREVRILLVTHDNEVRFDSDEAYLSGDLLGETDRDALIPPARGQPVLFEGRFVDPDGSEWIYVSQTWEPVHNSPYVIVAEPVPRPTLHEVFRQFGEEFFSPLLRAGLLGLLIALGLSVLIARSVARPLQRMSHAVQRMARGDLDQRVPVDGPREVRTLATSFNEMAERVATTQRAQRDFLANVSHDLRTPLTSIQGFSQAITEGVAAEPAAAKHAAQVIHDEAARLHRMVESLLDLARVEAGQFDMLRHAVQIGDLLQGVGDSLSVKAQEKGLYLEVDLPPNLPRIPGDGDRLAQVFTNLIDNAIKHTPPGGQVRLRAETDRRGVIITVSDTGEGIPAADLPRVFERFYQVDKSRQRDPRSGMGLGLAITRQIVEAHGGTIQVASKEGEGTVFTVWLPFPTPDMSTITARR